ncbi:MAG: polynucleotide kinase-phosphatase [Myxococcales bacterium]|nr:polynucleotide kinase-phosphatase [Myxococcales bacterium]
MSASSDKPTPGRVIEVPELCLVVLVGVSGSGKSTFARRFFSETEIVSSDRCRALVSDDENDQSATVDAFALVRFLAGKRLARGKLTVIDATSVRPEDRRELVELARQHECLAVAIVLDVPAQVAIDRNAARTDRKLGAWVVNQQRRALRGGLRAIRREGFSRVTILDSEAAIDAASVVRRPLWNDRRGETGPFDIIGDIHGCYDELVALLGRLGYEVGGTREAPEVTPPEGRRALFLGDLVDRGPDAPGVLRLVMAMVRAGAALCVVGNHEAKLEKKLRGRDVKLRHGLAETVEQLAREPEPERFAAEVADFIGGLISHYILDGGRLVVAHAGIKEALQGRASGRVRAFCLYGETSGEVDEYGLPVRHAWAEEYRGPALVVYGHTPVLEASFINNTICVDTGCVFGGKLSALRYPERELVDVPAARVYYEPTRPLLRPEAAPAPARRGDDLIDIKDVTGKRTVETRVLPKVTIREENAVAALEVMSRFAIDPRWLVYLPPTMSPSATAPEGTPLLERPHEALDYFAGQGVREVVCEEKHMGSRAVVVVARSREAAARRFRVEDGKQGVVYTRTGRPFFGDAAREAALIARVAAACEAAGLFESLSSEWLCLDAELMPWSLKARDLLRHHYAAVGAAAGVSLARSVDALAAAAARGVELGEVGERFAARRSMIDRYGAAWRRYCWETPTLDELRLAPFHLLASEGRLHSDRDHVWHMETLATLAPHDPILVATPYRVVDLDDEAARADAIAWWEALTAAGGEGMVIKPRQWIVRGPRGVCQPAIKCRGPEYLRIIYGPEYSAPENIERLRSRGLGGKRSLALREFALGLEGLARFAEGDSLWRVHECVFGVLALESEPVDPRL